MLESKEKLEMRESESRESIIYRLKNSSACHVCVWHIVELFPRNLNQSLQVCPLCDVAGDKDYILRTLSDCFCFGGQPKIGDDDFGLRSGCETHEGKGDD